MKHRTTTKWGWGLFKKSLSMCRSGKGMEWSDRPRSRIGWGVCIRLNSPPKINNRIHRKFYKEQSRNKLKRYIFSPI